MVSGTGKFVVTATVLAPGMDVVPGVLRVARHGEVLAERPVAEDGTVRLVVRDQRAGERSYRIVLPGTDVTTRVVGPGERDDRLTPRGRPSDLGRGGGIRTRG